MPALHQPYDIETFGEFRKIIQQGDFDAKVPPAAVMTKHPTTGVGAVAGARGEITIYDGNLIISYGELGKDTCCYFPNPPPFFPWPRLASGKLSRSIGMWRRLNTEF